MTELLKKYKCKQEGCPVATTGICLEGVLETCTHKILDTGEEEQNENAHIIVKEEHIQMESIYSGDVLSADDCTKITTSSPTRLIILAGSIDSGKTTMLASLMQLFQQNGEIAGFLFKGSRTLIGFEKRCFKSRTASMEDKAKTGRTTFKEEDEFLHLKVLGQDRKQYDLLFTDLSGERFKNITLSTTESQKFVIAKRADHFALFIDADLISDLTQRQQCRINSINILTSLSDAGMFHEGIGIEVIFSRWDLLIAKGNKETHDQFIEQIKKEILQKFGSKYKNINFYEVASRPEKDDAIKFGHGIDVILPKWITESQYIPTEELLKKSLTFQGNAKRQFGKY